MRSYGVQFVEGTSFRAGEASSFMGLRDQLSVKASSRVEAYMAAYRELSAKGEVTVLGYRNGDERPLGFGEQEQETVRRAGVPLTPGYPRISGSQVEVIAAESPPARTGLRLPELPDLGFNSWEDEVAGQWTIFYDTQIDSVETTFWVSEYEGSGFVEHARARFIQSGATGELDLDQARRDAADRVVVRKVLDALDYVREHPRVNGW
jgi:hypothetical protein